jgi:L-iditol 2-dehydrogenase
MMKAYVLHGINDLQYEDVPIPEPAADEVLVRVCAAGICGSDIPRIYQTGAHRHPLIPGHEFSGEVEAVGAQVDASWLHKPVGIFPLIPCGKCDSCRKKQYEMCRDYSYLGSRQDGGFAEYVTVPAWNLLELPAQVSFEEAAMLEPMAVAVHAMRGILGDRLDDPQYLKDSSVVVCGLGTIGLLLAMFLKEAGVDNLLLVGNKDFQRQCAGRLGVDAAQYCDCRTQEVSGWVRDHTAGRMASVVFECVGKNETVSQAIELTAPGGRVMLVGNPYSDMTLDKQVYWKILRNQLTIKGTWNSSYRRSAEDDWHYVLERLEKGRIHPAELISHRFSLADLQQGFLIMRDKLEDYVKIMRG